VRLTRVARPVARLLGRREDDRAAQRDQTRRNDRRPWIGHSHEEHDEQRTGDEDQFLDGGLERVGDIHRRATADQPGPERPQARLEWWSGRPGDECEDERCRRTAADRVGQAGERDRP